MHESTVLFFVNPKPELTAEDIEALSKGPLHAEGTWATGNLEVISGKETHPAFQYGNAIDGSAEAAKLTGGENTDGYKLFEEKTL